MFLGAQLSLNMFFDLTTPFMVKVMALPVNCLNSNQLQHQPIVLEPSTVDPLPPLLEEYGLA